MKQLMENEAEEGVLNLQTPDQWSAEAVDSLGICDKVCVSETTRQGKLQTR